MDAAPDSVIVAGLPALTVTVPIWPLADTPASVIVPPAATDITPALAALETPSRFKSALADSVTVPAEPVADTPDMDFSTARAILPIAPLAETPEMDFAAVPDSARVPIAPPAALPDRETDTFPPALAETLPI